MQCLDNNNCEGKRPPILRIFHWNPNVSTDVDLKNRSIIDTSFQISEPEKDDQTPESDNQIPVIDDPKLHKHYQEIHGEKLADEDFNISANNNIVHT